MKLILKIIIITIILSLNFGCTKKDEVKPVSKVLTEYVSGVYDCSVSLNNSGTGSPSFYETSQGKVYIHAISADSLLINSEGVFQDNINATVSQDKENPDKILISIFYQCKAYCIVGNGYYLDNSIYLSYTESNVFRSILIGSK
jgi:hypothetical protein